MNHEMTLVAAVFVMFLSQILYTKYLFETFRRKVYLDVLDFLVARGELEEGDVQQPEAKKHSRHIRLVSSNEKK